MRNIIKHKSDCKFCEEAIVLSPSGDKVIAHYKREFAEMKEYEDWKNRNRKHKEDNGND